MLIGDFLDSRGMALARGRKSLRDIASELSECNGFHLYQDITEGASVVAQTRKISEELTSGSNLAKALASGVEILVTEHDLVR